MERLQKKVRGRNVTLNYSVEITVELSLKTPGRRGKVNFSGRYPFWNNSPRI